MDPLTKAILLSWNWRPEVIIVLVLAATLYIRGWVRLRKRVSNHTQYTGSRRSVWRLTATWRPISYCAGLLFIALALLSPIDTIVQQLFFMHMIQHLLLMMVAPPLLLIANPLPFLLWGLPDILRTPAGNFIKTIVHQDSAIRRFLRTITNPGITWIIWVVGLISWHDPILYNAALEYEWVHDFEHLSFFLISMLLSWHITGAGPRIHKQMSLSARAGLIISIIPANLLTGVVLALATKPFYSYYMSVPRIWGIDVLGDQQIGGVIMWGPGSMMYVVIALILIYRLLDRDERKSTLHESKWTAEATLSAPIPAPKNSV